MAKRTKKVVDDRQMELVLPETVALAFTWRFGFVLGCILLAAMALGWRLVDLHVVEHGFLRDQAEARTLRHETLRAYRGNIVDRQGEPLAMSSPVDSLWLNPQVFLEEGLAQLPALASALNTPADDLLNRIQAQSQREFMYLRRKASPAKAQEVMALNIPGVQREQEYQRFYPAGEVAAHLVGFTNIDDHGQEGVELAYDAWLSGQEGVKRVLKDRRGRVIEELGVIEPAEPGKDLQLSLDLRLQYLAYTELAAMVQARRAQSGSAVVLDVHTGEVLAMVNQPSFNPNNRADIHAERVRNRALTDLFEPGSTMKPITVAAALASGRYAPSTPVNTSPGFMRIGRSSIRDARDYGVIDLTHIVTKSSNVGTSKIALSLDEQQLWSTFYKFGLGQATGLGFPGEQIGSLPSHSSWRPIELATLSYGYGLSVTSLQLAQVYSVIANGGIKYPLSLLKVKQARSGEQVIDPGVANQVKHMLQKVTEKGGTGTRAQVDAYHVAGKTGTVHAVARSGGYIDDQYQAIFAGFAPAGSPRVAIVVMVNDPKGEEYYGGEVAAPVFSRIVSGVMRILNVPPDNMPDTPPPKLLAARLAPAQDS